MHINGLERERGASARRIVGMALLVGLLAGACAGAAEAPPAADGREPIVGGPCEGCEAVYEGLPEELGHRARIAPEDEPGEPMRIEGRVLGPDGEPAPGVIVYAYHTDRRGIYPKDEDTRGQAAYRHGRLRAWVETDAEGRYRFDTIRPASYPETTVPAHVHLHVLEPGCCTYWIDSIHFLDDPHLDAEARAHQDGRGGPGLVTPDKDEDGTWVVKRDIVLGENVPGYPG